MSDTTRVPRTVCRRGHDLTGEDGYLYRGRIMCARCNRERRQGLLEPLDKQTHCKRGHPLADAYVGKNGGRVCRWCMRLRYEAKRDAAGKPKRKPVHPVPQDTATLAYAAGIFDGEGSVTIRRNRKPGSDLIYHGLGASVTSTDPVLTDWMLSRFGGTVTDHRHTMLPNNSPAKKWQVLARQAEAFLRAIRPYLLVKADRADLAFLLRESVTKVKDDGSPRDKVTPELFEYREGIRREVMRLNKHRRLAVASKEA